MTKYKLVLLFAIVFTLHLYSQNDRNDSLSIKAKSNEYSIKNTTNKYLLPPKFNILNGSIQLQDLKTFEVKPTLQMNDQLSNLRYSFEFQPENIRNQWWAEDFNKSQLKRLSDNFYINTGSQRKTYIDYGAYLQLNSAMRWKPNNRFYFELGGLFIRQFNNTGSHNDILGVNTQISFDLSPKIQLNIWGQYIVPSSDYSYFENPLFPNTNAGSSVSFQLKNQSQLDLGFRYQYYESNKKWKSEVYGKLRF
jgi:hypothetical protein